MENQTPTPKISKRQAKQSRGFARHGRIRVQSKASAIWGIFFKVVGLVLGATVAVSGIAIADLSNTIKANGIVLAGSTKVTEKDLAGPINMLLVGSDTRAGQGAGYGNETSVLADVIILLHVSADRKHATALSFPRDLLVPWPACPSTSIPPGPGCTLLTVEALTGLKIPYLAMIDFKGVIEMSNAIGGVEVCVTKPIHDSYTYLNLAAGTHVLQGKDALKFLRTRHGVGDGSDLSRISNQQVFLTSLVRKVKSAGVLGNPIYLYSLASAAARNMKLSESLTNVNVMVAMAGALKNVELDKMTFLQVPSRGGLPAPYSGRVAPIYETANLIFDKLKNDEPVVLAEANGGQGAVVASPAPSSSPSPSASASPNASALPTGVLGTTADTKTCSN
jgi:LCP family protein required for cell wall assembly